MEWKVLAILVAVLGAPMLAVRRRFPSGMDVPLFRLIGPEDAVDLDLPCPWCHGPTTEVDTSCRGCGRAFGI